MTTHVKTGGYFIKDGINDDDYHNALDTKRDLQNQESSGLAGCCYGENLISLPRGALINSLL